MRINCCNGSLFLKTTMLISLRLLNVALEGWVFFLVFFFWLVCCFLFHFVLSLFTYLLAGTDKEIQKRIS